MIATDPWGQPSKGLSKILHAKSYSTFALLLTSPVNQIKNKLSSLAAKEIKPKQSSTITVEFLNINNLNRANYVATPSGKRTLKDYEQAWLNQSLNTTSYQKTS